MVLSAMVILGAAAAVFVGINIGGSSTGVAFGPATGSGVISKPVAAGLMAGFALLGGVTLGPNVVETLSDKFVPSSAWTTGAAIVVLVFTGVGILVGNVRGISTSTSETAVGAVAGMGLALGVLNYSVVGEVMMWWYVAPMLGFWLSAVATRYFRRQVLVFFGEEGPFPERVRKLLVVGIGCFMAFSAGANNVANAAAPLVGAEAMGMWTAVLLGGAAIGVGAFLIGPWTMETVGHGITDLPLEGALFVETVAATIVTFLSVMGVPASLAITTTCCVMGYGWGRARAKLPIDRMVGATPGSQEREGPPYSVDTTRRFVVTWFATPLIAATLGLGAFWGASTAGWI